MQIEKSICPTKSLGNILKIAREEKEMIADELKVAELFAGVGGFRLGLEKNDNYETV